jgi:hypothetical protein
MSSFTDKFTIIDNQQAKVNATLDLIQKRLDSQDADMVSFKKECAAAPVAPASGAASSGGPARRPPVARVGGTDLPRRDAAGRRDRPDDARTKVFFKGFPAEIPRRLLAAWFDRLYALTDKEAGVERHIGSNSSFAVSFPSAEGAKRFMDQVRDDFLPLEYLYHDTPATIKMEPQYRDSVYGKAISSVWNLFSKHILNKSTEARPISFLVDTDRGRLRAEVDDEVWLLATIDKGVLVFNPPGLAAIGFSAVQREAALRDFVA